MNRILLVILVFSVQIHAFSQGEKNTPNKTIKSVKTEKEESVKTLEVQQAEPSYPITISVNQFGEQVTHDKLYFQNRLLEVENHLSSIDIKIDYVRSNPAEHAIATQNGWYEDMEATKERLRIERSELQSKIESFN